MRKIQKILIANRGEIALRIIKTCKRLGIKTVAVYSEADERSLHVTEADESVCIGSAESRDSYLNIEKIINACKETGADAVHPGYGFLSEKTDFCEALSKNKILFIGPTPEAIRIMGDKIESKICMEKAGVRVVPGYNGENQEPSHLLAKAIEIGFPVMIKAAAGGGGKGMRKVTSKENFLELLESAKREAINFFKDDKVLIEKFIENPRHIEFQIFGDTHGNVTHLFERDCSVQRRHQKIIEESPAPGMNEKLREEMGAEAVLAAKSIAYTGAGTVEFVVGLDNSYYFLEMNTRLQVEHPVTEMVTGLDLVELQILVAEGEELPFFNTGKFIPPVQSGHAIEVRIYAEDPDKGFIPSIGSVEYTSFPKGDGIRIDSAFTKGTVITPYYDPMIAKLIVKGKDRSDAISKLRDTLREFTVFGISTNIDYLYKVTAENLFRTGPITTSFIEEIHLEERNPEKNILAVSYASIVENTVSHFQDVWFELNDCEFWSGLKKQGCPSPIFQPPRTELKFVIDEKIYFTRLLANTGNAVAFRVRSENQEQEIDLQFELSGDTIIHNGESIRFAKYGRMIYLKFGSEHFRIRTDHLHSSADSDAENKLYSPMPGKITKLFVAEDEIIKAGKTLLVLEAMKMENLVKAPKDGKVLKIHCKENSMVMQDDLLIELHFEK